MTPGDPILDALNAFASQYGWQTIGTALTLLIYLKGKYPERFEAFWLLFWQTILGMVTPILSVLGEAASRSLAQGLKEAAEASKESASASKSAAEATAALGVKLDAQHALLTEIRDKQSPCRALEIVELAKSRV